MTTNKILLPYNGKASNFDYDYPFFDEHLDEELKYFFEQDGHGNIDTSDWKLSYSLSYSQGDGVGIREGKLLLGEAMQILKLTKKEIFKNYKTKLTLEELGQLFYFDLTCNSRDPYITVSLDYNQWASGYDEENTVLSDLEEPLKKYLNSIMDKLEKSGYNYIEEQDKDHVLWSIFDKFKNLNNIDSDLAYYEFNYTHNKDEAEQKGMTFISDLSEHDLGGDCQGFWVKLPELKAVDEVVTHFEFIN